MFLGCAGLPGVRGAGQAPPCEGLRLEIDWILCFAKEKSYTEDTESTESSELECGCESFEELVGGQRWGERESRLEAGATILTRRF